MSEQVSTEQAVDKCGTYAGWNQHQQRNEPQCQPCLAAQRAYMADYRASNPAFVERNRLRGAARSRALTRLANEYQRRFAEIYDEELAK